MLGELQFAINAAFVLVALLGNAVISCTGDSLTFHYLPPSIQQDPLCGQSLKKQDIMDLFSLMLGYSPEHASSTDGFKFLNPFALPRSIVVFELSGISPYSVTDCLYPVSGLHNVEHLKNELVNEMKVDGGDYLFLDVNPNENEVDVKSAFEDLPSLSGDANALFLQEIAYLKKMSSKLNPEEFPETPRDGVIWISLKGYNNIVVHYGSESTEARQAKILFQSTLKDVADSLKRLYGDNVAVTILNNNVKLRRVGRTLMQMATAADNTTDWNIAVPVYDDYPIIFNIILWTSLILVISIIAIAYAIGDMDPGRDSIIYRMTNQKMKKDA